jgi:hypothetical protein
MAGGVNPIEWVLPPVALTHMGVNAAAQQVDPRLKLEAPGSPNDRLAQAQAAADAQRQKLLTDATAAHTQAEAALNARTETPQEALDARRRAGASALALGGGKRRASQTLTDPGATLSGSY